MATVSVNIGAYLRAYIKSRAMPVSCGCWLWTKSINRDGYGSLGVFGRRGLKAHRVSYEAFNGEVPSGKWILHTCDVRSCVNPSHLYAGTAQDNVNDREHRGRSVRSAPPR